MGTKAITGADTLTIFDRSITDFADGDTSAITFPNELFTVKTGKNENTIYAKNAAGQNAEMTLRVMRGSSDDKFLQSKLTELLRDPASFSLGEGQFTKRLGDGAGNVTREVYKLSGGIFMKQVEGNENADGETEQAVAIYTLKFSLAVRSHQ